jgi:hypothetical protein
MQTKGILPPDKKRLNRKQFALDVLNIVGGGDFNFYNKLEYIVEAFSVMVPYAKNGKSYVR